MKLVLSSDEHVPLAADMGAHLQHGAFVSTPIALRRKRIRIEALGITPRELEVLQLIAEGLSNKEMADRLFVSENTVKTHASRVFDKLGASRRTQAVQLVPRTSWVGRDTSTPRG